MDTLTKEDLLDLFKVVHHDWTTLATSYSGGPKEDFYANKEMNMRVQVLWTQIQRLINDTAKERKTN